MSEFFLSLRLQPVLDSIAPELSQKAQLQALFQTYELGPDLLEKKLQSISSRNSFPSELDTQLLLDALHLAREYCLYREHAWTRKRTRKRTQFPWSLIRNLDPEIRTEAREWLGFWAQNSQGSWSDLQWVERGVRTHVNFEARELFARCLPLRPRALVLIHNHPSGNTEPSWMDLQLTRQVGMLASHLGIELKGHWIVGPHAETWIPI